MKKILLLLTISCNCLSAEQPRLKEAPLTDHEFVSYLQRMSDLVYKPVSELHLNNNISLFFTDPSNQKDETFAGFVERREGRTIVAFPGTRDMPNLFSKLCRIDIRKDISIFSSDAGYCRAISTDSKLKVHPSFATDVQKSFSQITTLIGDISNGNEIFFTGHSKGGGTATLAALKYAIYKRAELRKSQVKVFTFCQPPVLNESALELYHEIIGERNHINIYNNRDFVPYLPLSKFYHAGIQVNVNASGHTITDFDERRINSLMERLEHRYKLNPLMNRYEMGRI